MRGRLWTAVSSMAVFASISENRASADLLTEHQQDIVALVDAPILCTLSSKELHQRKATILSSLRSRVISRTPIAGGYRYEFAAEPSALRDVSRVAELERECCRFLTFDVGESDTSVWLDVTGRPEALAAIQELFG